ncbi:hypothetical protein [Ascidiimonas sp. W6]|uniref:hypothetical protein n=1 Tax=Ascidiimonas meishanensis TaxID=3128903 RepID=UPI0030EBB52C
MQSLNRLLLILCILYGIQGIQKTESKIKFLMPYAKVHTSGDNLQIEMDTLPDPDKILGTYYTTNFYSYMKEGFNLKKEKPLEEFKYSFEFKTDGTIHFTDLFEGPRCKNGILFLENATWKAKGHDKYVLSFKGEYSLTSYFHTQSEYLLVLENNGDFKLQLVKIIKNMEQKMWE